MQKILKVALVFVIGFLIITPNAFAQSIDCEYPEYGLTITYDDKDVKIDYEKFNTDANYTRLLGFKWGSGKYTTNEINIDQTLYEKYQGYSCPTQMHLCEYGEWSIDLPSITSLGYDIAGVFTAIPCIANWMDTDACNNISENAYSTFTIDKKKLYILTQEEYNNSEIKEYIGGKTSNDISDYKEAWGKWCNTGGFGGEILQSVCGNVLTVGGVLPLLWETIAKDGLDILYYKYTNCSVVPYEGPYTPININCTQLTSKIYNYREAIYEYTKCEGNSYCKSNAINNMNKVEGEIKNYCSNILQGYDYIEGQSDCIDSCLTIKETLNSFKEGTDLYDAGDNLGQCGFSARLLVWANNILRWIKYILPVLVIILAILDFIKAIGADKDDEMKKAQKRFIIRLIAAALVFIIPLILEFILNKMGFGYNSCGLF